MSLIVDQLTKTFGKQIAVNAISFEAKAGEILGFLGPNGAGKSTTMKIATGFLPPTSGSVSVCGQDVVEDSLSVRKQVGYLPEHNPLYLDMYVREYLQFIGSMYRLSGKKLDARVGEMIALCGLTLEQNKLIGSLSKGYRQRVGLAQALIHDPQVLILDEPTTGLDPNQLSEIRRLIKDISTHKTVIFSTHIMQEVQALCDRVVIINRGNIVIDSYIKDLQTRQSTTDIQQKIEVEFAEPLTEQFLKEVPGVLEVEAVTSNVFVLKAEASVEDLRPAIFHFAFDRQLVLLGMRQISQEAVSEYGNSLEDIFRSLTLN
ncbi:gliding motility-associated ABC transporter ATP-binding subunit GldA [Catalinimonas niigatensis]|uniref:gliding motility-associated ABC transporter ATP-binding subunit GldA n=1 Tax=Catalinimonas niigatensis TaxID=1397264 RepID=UPI00266697FD|nr:gliding motility-associated ABC transporter ATP-binding subunit GldA [Catalinimonas niigatensis]WPP51419.1 gliding motility-associated ABC transporter ATP-binding subunit GldA [Catalinimonas niigatensis]